MNQPETSSLKEKDKKRHDTLVYVSNPVRLACTKRGALMFLNIILLIFILAGLGGALGMILFNMPFKVLLTNSNSRNCSAIISDHMTVSVNQSSTKEYTFMSIQEKVLNNENWLKFDVFASFIYNHVRILRDNNTYYEEVYITRTIENISVIYGVYDVTRNITGNCTCNDPYTFLNDLESRIYNYYLCYDSGSNSIDKNGNITLEGCLNTLNITESAAEALNKMKNEFYTIYRYIDCLLEPGWSLFILIAFIIISVFFIIVSFLYTMMSNQESSVTVSDSIYNKI